MNAIPYPDFEYFSDKDYYDAACKRFNEQTTQFSVF
jgi:hypothetical protein